MEAEGPARLDQLGDRMAGAQDRLLQAGGVAVVDRGVIGLGQGILPDHVLTRHVRAQVADLRPHVAVGQLVPGAREGIGEFVGVVVEALGNLAEARIFLQRHVGGGHHGRQAAVGTVRPGRLVLLLLVLRLPLPRAGRALDQVVAVFEEHAEIVHAPLDGRRGPGAFQAAGDGVIAHAAFVPAGPAAALLGDVGALRGGADLRSIASAVALAEGVAAGGQGDGLLVAHRHARKGLADFLRRCQRVGTAAGPFGLT